MTKKIISLVFIFTFIGGCFAEEDLKEGAEYRIINSSQESKSRKIEVIEFFSYACGACYHFEPIMKHWLTRKNESSDFTYMPAVFNEKMVPLAKLYYSLEARGLLGQLHGKVYDAIHKKEIALFDRDSILKWVSTELGNEMGDFVEIYDSFSIGNKVRQAAKMTRNYKIPGTPYVTVGGRYLTGPSMLVRDGKMSAERFSQVLDTLIKKYGQSK